MREFYIIPSQRRLLRGRAFAHKIFARHTGNWQIKQIAGAEYAVSF
ncbi:MAG: hypothetical protein SFV15_04505 [Polyangiaceae bacterium]|nr:hypothetical protein [Polyangiaceae bacterium]